MMSEAAMTYEEAANAAISYMDEGELRTEGQLDEVMVLDDASAEMLIRRIREAEEQYEKMEAWYKFQLSKAKELRDRTVEWAEACLRPYMDMVPAKGIKIKTYELPGGTLRLAKQAPKYDTTDEELVPWLEKNGQTDMVQIKKEAKWGDFKKTLPKGKDGELQTILDKDGIRRVVTEDGEIVPGVTATLRDDKFSVTLK